MRKAIETARMKTGQNQTASHSDLNEVNEGASEVLSSVNNQID